MPAATSHEDIYNQTSSSNSLSSSFCSSTASCLPDYMMMFAGHQEHEEERDCNGSSSFKSLKQTCNLATTAIASNQPSKYHQTTNLHNNNNNQYQQQADTTYHYSHQAAAYDSSQYYYATYDDVDDILCCSGPIMVRHQRHVGLTEEEEEREEEEDKHQRLMLSFFPEAVTSANQHYLTIEELKSARNSCWLCGCNWQQDHVSLDCPECGGYALSRPCPTCDGRCKQVWKRNINGTHDHHKASWVGQCTLCTDNNKTITTATSKQQHQHRKRDANSHDDDLGQQATASVVNNNGVTASSVCSSQASSATSSCCELDCQHDHSGSIIISGIQSPPAIKDSTHQLADSSHKQSKSQQQQALSPSQKQQQQQQHSNHLCVCN